MTGKTDSAAPDRFFGYGSLVNRATHNFPGPLPARLTGWRRVWVHTAARPVAYLSVRPDPGCTIAGLVADVPAGDWAALDLREHAYARHKVRAHCLAGAPLLAQVYAVPPDACAAPQTAHPILLSYLDAVVQGFAREFGAQGVAEFFATTEGWHAPIRNDRAAPEYPRAQRLTVWETKAVDAALEALGVRLT